jgi:4-hydroxybenzoate polyprenyltransferase
MGMLLRLLRVQQWYKNIVIFIPLVFSMNLFNIEMFSKVLIGFFALCAMSSCNYILNDIVDAKRDRLHPSKKNRPIASGKFKKSYALLVALVIAIVSMLLSFAVGGIFIIWPIMLFISTQLYSFRLKMVPIVDVHMIALNFIIRTTAGSAAILVVTSPWLFLLAFLLALYLALNKRKIELSTMGGSAKKHRAALESYNLTFIRSLSNIVMAMLLASYAFYTFLANTTNDLMMLTVPVASFILFRYQMLSEKSERNDLILYDKQIVVAIVVWAVMSVAFFYFL